MYNDEDLSGGFNNLSGPYHFLNQAAVTNAMASGQNIDWAQLAQQWIQMRDNTTTTMGVTDITTNVCQGVSAPYIAKYEEKGEADMDMDDEEHADERTSGVDRSRRNQVSSIMQHQPISLNKPWLYDKSFVQNNDSRLDVGTHKSSQWSNNQAVLKTPCDNHGVHRQSNSTAHIPSLLSMNVPHPNDIRALPVNSNDQNSQQSMIDAAKRKALPAWIREGLEKMEREKQKQQDKHVREELPEDSEGGNQAQFQVATVNYLNLNASDDEDDDTVEELVNESGAQSVREKSADVDSGGYKGYEQTLSELMVVVRKTLTELLLEVTNEEISKVANETLKNCKLKGLAAYDDSSSSESTDGDEDESNPVSKSLASESGNDSEEEIKNSMRTKRRAFAKIANDIEERVAAAASKEEEKLKTLLNKEETSAIGERNKSLDRHVGATQREASMKDSTKVAAGSCGNLFDRDTGETTETKLQSMNGKLHKERGVRRERTTRFSDNKDNKYLAIATSASFIRDLQPKDSNNASISVQSLPALGQTALKNTAVISNASTNIEAAAKGDSKQKTTPSREKSVDRETDKKIKRRRASQDSTSDSETSSSSSSSSSVSSDSDSSTTNSSDNSRYSNKSQKKRSHTSSTVKSKNSMQHQRDKREDRKYRSSHVDKDRDSHHSRYRSDKTRSRSRSHHSRRRHGSHDSDKNYRRSKHDSRYSSSHSRSRNSSHRYHDYSTSNSRSSYSSSSNRRH